MPDKNKCALTPPMGWNSWDCYGASVTEEALMGNAEYMAENLKRHGWEYVVCDIQWSESTAVSTAYHPFAKLCMDEYGRLIPAPNRFPSGFKAIASRIHALGLKFGIHIMRGVPRQAVYLDCKVLGADVYARDIAMPFHECRWNSDMYGLNPDARGAREYVDSLFALYADWGVDFVKVDDICRTDYSPNSYASRREVELICGAIDRCGREMVLSLSPGPASVDATWHMCQNANMWRITDDLWDDWQLVKAMFERCEAWSAPLPDGCWPDCDMLPLGVLRMFDGGEPSRLTPDEQVTLMTLWCVFRSPLMMGGEMRRNDAFTLSLLTNDEALRLTRDSRGARQHRRDDREAVWSTTDGDGACYVALFNLSDEPREVGIDTGELSIAGVVRLYDIWKHTDIGEAESAISASLMPHACALYRLG